MTAKYVLRNLAGVAELEAMLDRIQAHPNPLWAPENDEVVQVADRLAKRLFGVGFSEVDFEPRQGAGPHRGEADSAWERRLWLVNSDEGASEDEEADNWLQLGWDVRRADGRPMLSMAFLDFFILAAIDGHAGRLPDAPPSDDEIERRAGDFEAKLRAEAEQFRKGR